MGQCIITRRGGGGLKVTTYVATSNGSAAIVFPGVSQIPQNYIIANNNRGMTGLTFAMKIGGLVGGYAVEAAQYQGYAFNVQMELSLVSGGLSAIIPTTVTQGRFFYRNATYALYAF